MGVFVYYLPGQGKSFLNRLKFPIFKKGSPIKGQVKKKNTSPGKKIFLFLLGHSARISTALF